MCLFNVLFVEIAQICSSGEPKLSISVAFHRWIALTLGRWTGCTALQAHSNLLCLRLTSVVNLDHRKSLQFWEEPQVLPIYCLHEESVLGLRGPYLIHDLVWMFPLKVKNMGWGVQELFLNHIQYHSICFRLIQAQSLYGIEAGLLWQGGSMQRGFSTNAITKLQTNSNRLYI